MKTYKIFLLAFLFSIVSCQDDFLDTVPESTVSSEQLASNPASFEAIVKGIYANLRAFGASGTTFHVDYGHRGIMAALDMMGGDVTQSVFHWYGFFLNYSGREQTASRTRLVWNTYYKQIADANSVINGIDINTTDESAKALLGQALAIRGFCYFQLARIYSPTYIGNTGSLSVPIVDGKDFAGKPRATVEEVYSLIISDLESAIQLLSDFSRASKQEVDQSLAQAFLAKVYLETGNWSGAAEMANAARTGYNLLTEEEYKQGFSNIANTECMWGADINAETSSTFASFFSHFDTNNGGYAGALGIYKEIDANLYSMIPDSDYRKDLFVNPDAENPSPRPYANLKFHDNTFFEGDYIYMRVSEMYLIEAEALARAGSEDLAKEVLVELVSERDAEFTEPSTTGSELINDIYLQRRIELWGEGESWFDLKRLSKPLMRDYEGSNHLASGKFNFDVGANEFLFQLPEDEINSNEFITPADQNPL